MRCLSFGISRHGVKDGAGLMACYRVVSQKERYYAGRNGMNLPSVHRPAETGYGFEPPFDFVEGCFVRR